MKKKQTKQNRRRKSAPKKRKKPSGGSSNHGRRKKKKSRFFSMPNIAPWKIILTIMVLGGLGMLYLKNVFATQKLLAEVQKKEQQYKQAKRAHDNYQLKYDRMIGPSDIYNKAKARGFINGGPAEKILEVPKK